MWNLQLFWFRIFETQVFRKMVLFIFDHQIWEWIEIKSDHIWKWSQLENNIVMFVYKDGFFWINMISQRQNVYVTKKRETCHRMF